jgi:hypothetical protein
MFHDITAIGLGIFDGVRWLDRSGEPGEESEDREETFCSSIGLIEFEHGKVTV